MRGHTTAPARDPAAPDGATPLSLLVICDRSITTLALPASGEVRIGRARDCEIVIDDASISRQHARLSIGPSLSLRDLGSANGTRAHARALAAGEDVAIAPGDVVQLGNATLIVQQRPPSAAEVGAAAIADRRMQDLHRLVERIAAGTITVLILGETGVGKEVLAERIHQRSPRAAGPFLKFNCAALSESLLESELFGHERGAFTGAVQTKPGLLETADGGTVFLDEIGELPLAIQAKLLRVLEERIVTRVGGLKPRAIDLRFVAATNRDLEREIERGAFRRDLFYRINGATLVVPPLRERSAEIPELARSFIAHGARQLGLDPPPLSPEALDVLRGHRWPGNIRELRNVIERAILLCGGEAISPRHLPLETMLETMRATPPGAPRRSDPPPRAGSLAEPGDLDERARIVEALAAAAGNQSHAARLLGIARRTLINKLERYGISGPRKNREGQ